MENVLINKAAILRLFLALEMPKTIWYTAF